METNVVVVGKVGGCLLKAVTTSDGKTRFESDCLDKESRDQLAAIFEEEAILRVTPKAFIEEIPGIEPVPEPTES
ncbi:unnamed protein product [marine sediment metagenome]|uniref:Uncharacterized protein n=1 Tax=marine sediment metagenome TaxID=412755 RepID=X1J7T7_9ZZZZ